MDNDPINKILTLSDGSTVVHTDFDKAFQSGFRFQYKLPYRNLETIEFSTASLDEVILPSGQIVAADPLSEIELDKKFVTALAPGHYPVVLSLAGFPASGERRVACAKVLVTHNQTTRWTLATIYPDRSTDHQAYGVDSGTGSFLALEAALAIKQLAEPDPDAYQNAQKKGVKCQGRRLTRQRCWRDD